MNSKAIKAAAIVSVILTSGCASIINNKTQDVNISASNGAPVTGTIDGVPFTGPGVVAVTRENKDKKILATTPGCAPETVMTKSVDSTFFINVLSGGVFGSTTDYATEKMWRYDSAVTISCK